MNRPELEFSNAGYLSFLALLMSECRLLTSAKNCSISSDPSSSNHSTIDLQKKGGGYVLNTELNA